MGNTQNCTKFYMTTSVVELKCWHLCLHIVFVSFAALSFEPKGKKKRKRAPTQPCSSAHRHVDHQKGDFADSLRFLQRALFLKLASSRRKENMPENDNCLVRVLGTSVPDPGQRESTSQAQGASQLPLDPHWHPDVCSL